MNEEQLLKTLARSARQQAAPPVDVSGRVLRDIRMPRTSVDSPMALMAGLSAVAALIMLAYTAGLYSAWQDPMTEMLLSSIPVLQ
jgi:hypothetical protein